MMRLMMMRCFGMEGGEDDHMICRLDRLDIQICPI